MDTLILFDIDGTLLLSGGAGVTSMVDAGRALFGASFTAEGIDYAGRLDPIIWRMMAERNDVDVDRHDDFRAAYIARLGERLGTTHHSRALPGAADLVDALHDHARATLGIVTGNYRESGGMKVANAGFELERFTVSAWGDDGATRRDLPRIAMERYAERQAGPIDPSRVVIIGDTPHDVDCARANGCRVIAVTTGPSYSRDDLAAHEPDLLVDDLSDTAALMDFVLSLPVE